MTDETRASVPSRDGAHGVDSSAAAEANPSPSLASENERLRAELADWKKTNDLNLRAGTKTIEALRTSLTRAEEALRHVIGFHGSLCAECDKGVALVVAADTRPRAALGEIGLGDDDESLHRPEGDEQHGRGLPDSARTDAVE